MNNKPKSAVLLLGGGIDSTTLLFQLVADKYRVHSLVFDYGQRLGKEVPMAYLNATDRAQMPAKIVRVPLGWCGYNSALVTAHRKTPEDRNVEVIARDRDVPASYVPFRNGIFLAMAVAYGEDNGIAEIYCGGNGLLSGHYPDDTRQFGAAFQKAAEWGTGPNYTPLIHFPNHDVPKAEIVRRGLEIGVEYKHTWSCYNNGHSHCGRCDSCAQRKAALEANGLDIHGGRLG